VTIAGLAAIVAALRFVLISRPDTSGPFRRGVVLWIAMPVAVSGPWLVLQVAFGTPSPSGSAQRS